jgi:hypothetical protein
MKANKQQRRTRKKRPVQPTGRQNKFVLSKLQECGAGITTVEFVQLGVADPRPRVRDLRGLGWDIKMLRESPRKIGLYVLMAGGAH